MPFAVILLVVMGALAGFGLFSFFMAAGKALAGGSLNADTSNDSSRPNPQNTKSDDPNSYKEKGNFYFQQQCWEDARDQYLKAIEINQKLLFSELDDIIYANLSMTCINEHCYDEAIEWAEIYIQLHADSHIGYECKGLAYFQSGNIKEAIQTLQVVVAIDYFNMSANYCLGASYCRLGDIENAQRHANVLREANSENAKELEEMIALASSAKARKDNKNRRHEKSRYYKVLGVPVNASIDEIKSAYRDLVKVWHPDRFGGDPKLQKKAEDTLKEINEAYQAIQQSAT